MKKLDETIVRAVLVFGAMLTVFASPLACSSGTDTPDTGVDMHDADAPPPDGGRLGLCPQEANPACMRAGDCAADSPKESNCGGCAAYNNALCATAACTMPDRLLGGDTYNIFIGAGVLGPTLKSFASHAIAATTAGGNTITCEDIYQHRVDLTEPCYNIMESRGSRAVAQPGDVYQITLGLFPGGQKTLFVIFGYSEENSGGGPIGVSCTAVDVEAPGGGRKDVGGDMMHPI